jgi:hypothetical protein
MTFLFTKDDHLEGWVWWLTPIISATQESEVRRAQSKAGPVKSSRPYLKSRQSKKD